MIHSMMMCSILAAACGATATPPPMAARAPSPSPFEAAPTITAYVHGKQW